MPENHHFTVNHMTSRGEIKRVQHAEGGARIILYVATTEVAWRNFYAMRLAVRTLYSSIMAPLPMCASHNFMGHTLFQNLL